ncbi:putative serine/threonine-protein kinase [Quercus lobata]|uniref:putative serine/threonine-protein kinase n=1 Tax=Quercus lobata TaxID=97700 RepID=UPI001247C5A0|nr:putative serine/threonine-protein kinase [Quercus lobata]
MGCNCFGGSRLEKKKGSANSHHEIDENLLGNIKHFSHKELRLATDNFHPSNKIGQGGFGTVYKGTLKSGIEVAVKTLSAQSKQGLREFLTEINTISNVRHPNLVELLGCCVQESNRILVYEYVENNSLDRALLGSKSRNIKLDWGKRSAICLGTARGLAFLHEELIPHIVHRDIKASNILLDKDFNPKIGDFGLAKLFPDDITHISTRIAGTTGYLAPEYALGGQLTMKADVYSFGVLILEIISGRSSAKANWGGMEKFLLEWAWELYQENRLLELLDPELEGYPEEEIIRYMKVAFFCSQAIASRRPLMSQVVEMLSRNIRLNEKELTAPGFFTDAGESSSKKGSIMESTSYQMSSVPETITQYIEVRRYLATTNYQLPVTCPLFSFLRIY